MASGGEALAQQAVTVSATPILCAIPLEEKRDDELKVLVRVKAAAAATKRRAPIDLVAVLNVSGKNEKETDPKRSRLYLVKNAVKFIIETLDDDDRLAVVAKFNNQELVNAKLSPISAIGAAAGGRKWAYDLVNAMVADDDGGTSFAAGLNKAFEILKGRPDGEGDHRLGVVFFVSDGTIKWDELEGGEGGEEAAAIRTMLGKHAVHTFGMGEFHDPVEMHAIATASGGGTYSFLDDGGLDKITDAFAVCLGGLSTVVATNVVVRLDATKEGVQIKSRVVEPGSKSWSINVPALYAGEVKEFIVILHLPAAVRTGGGEQELLTIKASYRDTAGTPFENEQRVGGGAGKQPPEEDSSILPLIVLSKWMDLMELLMKGLPNFNKEEYRQGYARSVRNMWSSIITFDRSPVYPLEVTSAIEKDVVQMADNLEQGKGFAFFLSWESSRRTQRAATMGSPDKVVPKYKTEAMTRMADEAKGFVAGESPRPRSVAAPADDDGERSDQPPPTKSTDKEQPKQPPPRAPPAEGEQSKQAPPSAPADDDLPTTSTDNEQPLSAAPPAEGEQSKQPPPPWALADDDPPTTSTDNEQPPSIVPPAEGEQSKQPPPSAPADDDPPATSTDIEQPPPTAPLAEGEQSKQPPPSAPADDDPPTTSTDSEQPPPTAPPAEGEQSKQPPPSAPADDDPPTTSTDSEQPPPIAPPAEGEQSKQQPLPSAPPDDDPPTTSTDNEQPPPTAPPAESEQSKKPPPSALAGDSPRPRPAAPPADDDGQQPPQSVPDNDGEQANQLPPAIAAALEPSIAQKVAWTLKAATAAETATVTTTPILSAIPLNEQRDAFEFEVLVRIEAVPVAQQRAPIDLVAVLDVSGSMNWFPDKNKLAADPKQSRLPLLKTAMKFIIEKLGDDDRLAIVKFNHKLVNEDAKLSPISFGAEGRKWAYDFVNDMEAGGTTSFKPGLKKAVEILDHREESNRLAFIVFLSDGVEYPKATINWGEIVSNGGGEEEATVRAMLRKYAVHTFGFSKFHDPGALYSIAKASHGTYSFLNEGLDKITDAFAVCLGGLSTVVATDVVIHLNVVNNPSAQGHLQLQIESIDSGDYDNDIVKPEKKYGSISVPVLYAGEVKNFIVHLRLPTVATDGQQELLTIKVCSNSSSLLSENEEHGEAALSIEMADGSAGKQTEDSSVLQQVILFKVLAMLAEFPAQHPGIKPGTADEGAAKDLRNLWERAKKSFPIWSGAMDVIEAIGEDVEQMAKGLEQDWGAAAYLLSWVSSRGMQRATTMGSPDKVATEYETEAMKKMAGEANNYIASDAPKPPPPPPPAAPEAGKVTLKTEPNEKVIPSDDDCKRWPVLVRLVAPARAERAPIDLVAVMDVSGSMGFKTSRPGWKRLDLAKSAMDIVTNKLAAADHLAVVPFNVKVTAGATGLMEMTPVGRAEAMAKVRSLKAGGGTKYLPALKRASDILEQRSPEEKRCRPGFIFLLTDGEDKSIIGKLLVHGEAVVKYPVHTFGMCQIGNPKSMLYVASETKGTYYPINDDIDNVAKAMGVFLAGITSVVAVNARVHLHAPGSVLIAEIESGKYDKSIEEGGKDGHINVGVMSANEEKKFTVYLDVPTKEQLLLTATGEYNKPCAGQAEAVKMDESKVEVQRPVAAAAGGEDDGEGDGGAGGQATQQPPSAAGACSHAVMVEITRIEIVKIVTVVLKKHEEDDTPDHHQMAAALTAACASSSLGNLAEEEYVKQMAEWLTKQGYVGVLYVHAWLASHLTQQATIVAASPAVAGDCTVAHGWFQQQYMQQAVADAMFHVSSLCVARPPWAHATEHPCSCDGAMDMFDQRLELWSRLKHETTSLTFQQSSASEEGSHLAAVFGRESREATDRAMHHDMYLAVVHASQMVRCGAARKPQQQHHQSRLVADESTEQDEV